MKIILSLVSLMALLVVIPKDTVPVFDEHVGIVHAENIIKNHESYVSTKIHQPCTRGLPYTMTTISSGYSPDGVPSPIHCTTCGLGVFALATDNMIRCSYCKHLQD